MPTTFTILLSVLVALARGCSEPEGGYVDPTPEQIVHYAPIVAVGRVTEIITPDPMFGDMYGSAVYGARVTVHCTYKGDGVPGNITIGGAGTSYVQCK